MEAAAAGCRQRCEVLLAAGADPSETDHEAFGERVTFFSFLDLPLSNAVVTVTTFLYLLLAGKDSSPPSQTERLHGAGSHVGACLPEQK